jgi:hypothetical protein
VTVVAGKGSSSVAGLTAWLGLWLVACGAGPDGTVEPPSGEDDGWALSVIGPSPVTDASLAHPDDNLGGPDEPPPKTDPDEPPDDDGGYVYIPPAETGPSLDIPDEQITQVINQIVDYTYTCDGRVGLGFGDTPACPSVSPDIFIDLVGVYLLEVVVALEPAELEFSWDWLGNLVVSEPIDQPAVGLIQFTLRRRDGNPLVAAEDEMARGLETAVRGVFESRT